MYCSKAKPISAYSLNYFANTVRQLNSSFDKRIVAICDADFDRLNHIHPPLDVKLTDTHDSETLIIKTVGIDALIAEYGTEKTIEKMQRKLLPSCLKVCFEMGLLKWLNNTHNYQFKFKGLYFKDFIHIKDLTIKFNQQAFIKHVLKHSHGAKIHDKQAIITQINQLRKQQPQPYLLCSGHDLSLLLTLIFKQPSISIKTQITKSEIESDLRKSFTQLHFQQTQLYKELIQWSIDNDRVLF